MYAVYPYPPSTGKLSCFFPRRVMVWLPSHATAPKSSLTNSLSWAQVLTQLGAPHAAVQIAEPTPQGAHWSNMVKDGQRWTKMDKNGHRGLECPGSPGVQVSTVQHCSMQMSPPADAQGLHPSQSVVRQNLAR